MKKINPTEENIKKRYKEIENEINDQQINYKYPEKPKITHCVKTLEKDINEIKLWKIDRQVDIKNKQDLYDMLNDLGDYYDKEKAEKTLKLLLDCGGIKLAVASAILNVYSNEAYPVFDKRAYRAIEYFNSNGANAINYIEDLDNDQIKTYINYCDKLLNYCNNNSDITFTVNGTQENLNIKNIDKYLYQYDVKTGLKLKLKR